MVDMDLTSRNSHVVLKEEKDRATQSHPDVGLDQMEVAVLRRFFKPSAEVQKMLDPALLKMAGKYVSNASHTVQHCLCIDSVLPFVSGYVGRGSHRMD